MCVGHRGVGARQRRELRALPQLARVRDLAPQRGRRRRRRRAEVHPVVGSAAAAGEVSVERPHRHRARRRGLAHADARPARGLENPSARGKGVGVDAAANEQVEDLARAWRQGQIEVLRQGLSAEDGRYESDVLERRVDRAADADLTGGEPCGLVDGNDIARRGRHCDQRLELVQLDHLELVVDRSRVGRQRDELFLAALQRQPLECLLIAGEDAGGRAGLHHHVADRPPVGCGQPGDAVTEELEDQPPAAADVAPPQQLEHDVFRLHPGLQPAAQLDARDPRALELRTACPPSPRPPRSRPRRSPASRAPRPWSCGCPRRAARGPAGRSARGEGSARCRFPDASRAPRNERPNCEGTRGPRGSCCRTAACCGRRTRLSGRPRGRRRAARTAGRPWCRSRPRGGSGRCAARSPPRCCRRGVRR